MPKGVPNKRYTPEFKRMVVETMEKEHLSIYAAMQEFGINDHKIIERWERIYLEEGPEGLAIERRGRSSKRPSAKAVAEAGGRRSASRSAETACGERLPKKTCKPWFWKTSDASAENAGSSKAEAKTFSGYSSLNRSTAPCHFLLSSEADEQFR